MDLTYGMVVEPNFSDSGGLVVSQDVHNNAFHWKVSKCFFSKPPSHSVRSSWPLKYIRAKIQHSIQTAGHTNGLLQRIVLPCLVAS